MNLKKLSEAEYKVYLSSLPASTLFKKSYKRSGHPAFAYKQHGELTCYIYEGDLSITGSWQPPGDVVLIVGNLEVTSLVNAHPAYEDEKFQSTDNWGELLVIGNVTCETFSNHYQKEVFIDGNLVANNFLLNKFDESSLTVTGTLETGFLYAGSNSVWVGEQATGHYAIGSCRKIPTDPKDIFGAYASRFDSDEDESLELLQQQGYATDEDIDFYALYDIIKLGGRVISME